MGGFVDSQRELAHWVAVEEEKRKSCACRSRRWPTMEGERSSLNSRLTIQANNCQVLTVPVYGQIRQLVVSPNGAFMAIVTAHTVHIAVLPDSAHLVASDRSPIRLKTYQLGPTTHVIPESPVVSAIWHPLGVHSALGGCIVTVTADAAVRVWELDRNNHWSFDRPTLAIDLKKLVDGTSCDQDFSPPGFGKNRGFSADSFDMEVASACFGGDAAEGEDAWAPMTLWVAMRPGDIYALCPLLPSKWQAPPATIPSLSAAIIPKLAAAEEDESDPELADQLTACRQQFEWLREIDQQEAGPESESAPDFDVLTRPSNPSVIPRLQGPFHFDVGDQVDDLEVTDLLVIPSKLDTEALMTGEEDEGALAEDEKEGLSATVICVSTRSGRVHICLETEGVEGQWLPKAKATTFTTSLSEPADLVLLESLDTVRENLREPHAWPVFTKDVYSRYNFFLTTANNVAFLSLSAWAQRLEAEFQAEDTAGSAFRIGVLCDGNIALRELIIQMNESDITTAETPNHLSASLVFADYDLGYLLLTYRGPTPQAAILDEPSRAVLSSMSRSIEEDAELAAAHEPLPLKPRRAPYQVPAIFYAESPLRTFVEDHVPHRHRSTLREQVRLSPATLDIIAAAHRVLSAHTGVLERAAADLFRRCERLRAEMRDQLEHIATIAERIRNVSSSIDEHGGRHEGSRSEASINARLEAARARQAQLVRRHAELRNKIAKLGGRPLSDREQAWIREVQALSQSIEEETDEQGKQTLKQRLEIVRYILTFYVCGRVTNVRLQAKSLAQQLLAESKRADTEQQAPPEAPSPARIPERLQRAKVSDAMRMVERE